MNYNNNNNNNNNRSKHEKTMYETRGETRARVVYMASQMNRDVTEFFVC
jgi:hypothetical protein